MTTVFIASAERHRAEEYFRRDLRRTDSMLNLRHVRSAEQLRGMEGAQRGGTCGTLHVLSSTWGLRARAELYELLTMARIRGFNVKIV